MDCSLSGSSVHGIFQARVLEWIAISFSRGYSRPRKHCPFLHHDPGVRRLALLRVSESIQVWFSNPNNKDSFLKTAKYVSLTFLPVLGTKVSPGPDPPRLPCRVYGPNPRSMARGRTGISDETVLMQGLLGVSLRETRILKPDSLPSPWEIQQRITRSSEERMGEKTGATEQEMWLWISSA